MPDTDDKLTPADRKELEGAVAFTLRFEGQTVEVAHGVTMPQSIVITIEVTVWQ